jgi:hypothetical protein
MPDAKLIRVGCELFCKTYGVRGAFRRCPRDSSYCVGTIHRMGGSRMPRADSGKSASAFSTLPAVR